MSKLFFIIISVLLFVLFVMFLIFIVNNPNNPIVKFVFDWRFRALNDYRNWFLEGQKLSPPNSFAFWYDHVIADLNTGNRAKWPLQERQDLANMLGQEQFVNYYFQEAKYLDGFLLMDMWNDYRSGNYMAQNYAGWLALQKALPKEISSNPKAFAEYIKLAEAGWVNPLTGLPEEGIQKQKIGRALKLIVQRNISGFTPAEIFAPFFGITQNQFREWARVNKNNKEITDNIDADVREILK